MYSHISMILKTKWLMIVDIKTFQASISFILPPRHRRLCDRVRAPPERRATYKGLHRERDTKHETNRNSKELEISRVNYGELVLFLNES